MTEEEAKTKVCLKLMQIRQLELFTAIIEKSCYVEKLCNCIASDCMMGWRELPAGERGERYGYCGLGGKL